MDPERAALVWVWLVILWEVYVNRLTKWVLAALLLIVIAQGIAIYRGRRALYDANLAAANERARHDRTRVRLSGQVLVAERRAAQTRVQLDAALRRPGRNDQLGVGVAIGKKVVVDSARAAVAVDTGKVPVVAIEAKLDARDSLGVFVNVHTDLFGVAAVAPAPQAWTRFEVTREPLLLDVSLSCERTEHGNDAVVQVSGPRWAALDITEPQVEAEVCNPKPPAWRPFQIKAPSLPVAGGLVVVGWILHDVLARH